MLEPPSTTLTPPRRGVSLRQLVGVAVATVVLATAGSALAGSQTFTDVAPSHPFSAEIERIAAAGITTGNPDGTYRPGATVSRGAMAAFMSRGFSSVSIGSRPFADPVSFSTVAGVEQGDPVPVTSTTVEAGATGGGFGMTVLSATVNAYAFAGVCPCQVGAYVQTEEELVPLGMAELDMIDGVLDAGGVSLTSFNLSGAFDMAADTTDTFTLYLYVATATGPGQVQAIGDLVVTYVPFLGDVTIEGSSLNATGASGATSGGELRSEPPAALTAP